MFNFLNWAAPTGVEGGPATSSGDTAAASGTDTEDATAQSQEAKKVAKATANKDLDIAWHHLLTDTYNLLWKLIIRPPRAQYDLDDLGPTRFRMGNDIFLRRDVQVKNDRGLLLECSHFIPEDPSLDDGRRTLPCVIYLHGNCSCRLESKELLHVLLPRGVSLFCLDCAGSGHSEGEYISLGFFEQRDLKAAVKYLRGLPFITGIGLWGRSMGAATCVFRAADDWLLGAMVMDSPFSNLPLVAQELVNSQRLKVPDFLFNRALQMVRAEIQSRAHFDIYELLPIRRAPHARSPALFVVATDDDFVLAHHTRDLHRAWGGNERKLVELTGGHNGMRPRPFLEEAATFLKNRLSAAPPRVPRPVSATSAAYQGSAGSSLARRPEDSEDLSSSMAPPPPPEDQLAPPPPPPPPAERHAPSAPRRQAAAAQQQSPAARRALAGQLVAMGFSHRQAEAASRRHVTLDAALEWLLTAPSEAELQEEEEEEPRRRPQEESRRGAKNSTGGHLDPLHEVGGQPAASSASAGSWRASTEDAAGGTRQAAHSGGGAASSASVSSSSSGPVLPSGSSGAHRDVVKQLKTLGCSAAQAEEAALRYSTVEGAVDWLISRGAL